MTSRHEPFAAPSASASDAAPRILVVGAGAVGGYFGGRLLQAGRDVTFLVRGARAAELRSEGLRIVSPFGAGDATLSPKTVERGRLDGPYDIVFVSVKAYGLEAALADVAPAVGAQTTLYPVLNGMRHLDVLAAAFGERAVIGGVCLVATTVDDAGRIVQLQEIQELVYGERDGARSARIDVLDRAMNGAGFVARSSDAIVLDMWRKWAMLASAGAISCTMRGTVGDVEAVPGGADFARAVFEECADVAAASGHGLGDEYLARTRAMLTAKGSPLATSMYRDMRAGRDVESDAILGDLVERGRRLGVATPMLAVAYANLCGYRNPRDASKESA